MTSVLRLTVFATLAMTQAQGHGPYGRYYQPMISANIGCGKFPVGDPYGVCYQLWGWGKGGVLQCPLGSRFNPRSCTCDMSFPLDPRRDGGYVCARARGMAVAGARAAYLQRTFANTPTAGLGRLSALSSSVSQLNAQADDDIARPAQSWLHAFSRGPEGVLPTKISDILINWARNPVTQAVRGGDGSFLSSEIRVDNLFDDVLEDFSDDLLKELFNDDKKLGDSDDFDFHLSDDRLDFDLDDALQRGDTRSDRDDGAIWDDDLYDDLLEDIFDDDGYEEVFDNDKYANIFNDGGTINERNDRNDDIFDNKSGLLEQDNSDGFFHRL